MAAEEHLRLPTEAEISAAEFSQVNRMDVDCNLKNEQFVTLKNEMAAQYADLYFVRLAALKKQTVDSAEKLWPDAAMCGRILEAKTGVRTVLVGTIYKDMKLKPNILKKYSGEEQSVPDVTADGHEESKNLVSDSDYAVIEDESGRLTVIMEGKDCPKTSDLVTGVIMGMVGLLSEEGSFIVEGVCYPGIPPQDASEGPKGAQVLIVSGLGLGGDGGTALSAEMLVDWVVGSVGCNTDYAEAAKIVRVIVAGNSCAAARPEDAAAAKVKGQASAHPVRDLDMLLTRLCAAVPVDLMPGETDPTGVFLPQQPFHRCLLPSANSYPATFRSVTNPYSFQAAASETATAGPVILGCSGQNVSDVLRYSTLETSVEVLEMMLQWRHMAPTAPDTLSCFPLAGTDPFILESCPRVFFAGNQESFASKVIEGHGGEKCLALSLPQFSNGGSAALVDLETLKCTQIGFDVTSIAMSQ